MKVLMNKLFVSGILIIIQLFVIFLILFRIVNFSPIFRIISFVISVLMLLYIVSKDEDSGYKISWIILVLGLPFYGGVLYFLFGNKKPARHLRKAYAKEDKKLEPFIYPNHLAQGIDDEAQGQIQYLNKMGYPVYQNTGVKYYCLGDDSYPDLIRELKKAKHFIFMEYFIVSHGEMLDEIVSILKQKVKEGVEVRFMYDDVGSYTMIERHYYRELRKYGIQAVAFNPFIPVVSLVMNNRDHRKITIIDGTIGFCGGFNLADEYINKKVKYGHWKDTGLMIKGDAVWNLSLMFLETWHVATKTSEDIEKYHPSYYELTDICQGYILPYGDSPLDDETTGVNVYLNMINQASQYVYIDTPYLILNEQLQSALILAVKRGVDVRITTPGIPDKKIVFRATRSYYQSLIEGGVRIYEYTPGFMHAKNFVVDDKIATIGTINLDYRSLYLHFECGVYLYKTECIQDIKQDYLHTIEVSKEISQQDVINGRFKGLFESVLRVFAPLL